MVLSISPSQQSSAAARYVAVFLLASAGIATSLFEETPNLTADEKRAACAEGFKIQDVRFDTVTLDAGKGHYVARFHKSGSMGLNGVAYELSADELKSTMAQLLARSKELQKAVEGNPTAAQVVERCKVGASIFQHWAAEWAFVDACGSKLAVTLRKYENPGNPACSF